MRTHALRSETFRLRALPLILPHVGIRVAKISQVEVSLLGASKQLRRTDHDEVSTERIPESPIKMPASSEQELTLPNGEKTTTFRYFVLSVLVVIPGTFLSQMSYFRTNKVELLR